LTVDTHHSTRTTSRTKSPNTVGYRFDQNRTKEVDDEFEEDRGQHPGIVALSGDLVKKGKRDQCIGESGKSSLLFKMAVSQ
jgi:hypothetical protein